MLITSQHSQLSSCNRTKRPSPSDDKPASCSYRDDYCSRCDGDPGLMPKPGKPSPGFTKAEHVLYPLGTAAMFGAGMSYMALGYKNTAAFGIGGAVIGAAMGGLTAFIMTSDALAPGK